MQLLRGILGIATVLLICLALSRDRKGINLRVVLVGIALQVLLALFVFKTGAGQAIFREMASAFGRFLDFSYQGSSFVFGSLGQKPQGEGLTFAFQALPMVIYFSGFMAILYHFGIMQVVIYALAKVLGAALRVSGAESMVVTAEIFVGMTESPLVVRPYLEKMTRSELMTLMTAGFATLAGTVLGIYMLFVGPKYASLLIAASVMAAPAAFVTAKIMVPEREVPVTGRDFRLVLDRPGRNVLDAISIGVRDGLHLVLNIAAMLIAFYGLIALVNWPLEAAFDRKIQDILGLVLSPFAWCLGVDWADAQNFGSLLGTKIVINEWVGYQQLQEMIRTQALSDRSIQIATFALCGFANFGSIGVTLGGIGQLAPSRRSDLAEMVLLAMVAGALSSCLTASIAGMLL